MSIVLAPYITVFEKQHKITPTERRDEYKQKNKDRETYNAKYVAQYLKTDESLDKSEMILAMGATSFLLFASLKGCCDVQWEKLFKFSPKTYCQYVDEAYEKISSRFPKVLDEYNELYSQAAEKQNKENQKELNQ